MNSIFLFRRDFRIIDNIGYNKCVKESKKVYPIFIFTPKQITHNSYKSDNAIQFMIESLDELSKNINITFLYGNNSNVLKELIDKYKINAIYTNTDYTPFAIKRDKELEKICKSKKIQCHISHDICLFQPGTIKPSGKQVYQKFTPFYNVVMKKKVNKPLSNPINKTQKLTSKYQTNLINIKYVKNDKISVRGGRKNGLKIINNLNRWNNYNNMRNQLTYNTTKLSAYLKFGCVSVREVFHKINNKSMKRQLVWRDFYYHLGFVYPHVFGKPLKLQYSNIKWSKNQSTFNAWKNAKTGFPIIDACMTELNTTGYMHNRGRLIVASFLIKNLLHDWRKGEKYFATKLVDYDPLVNNGNWQWVASTGADSQPYFRIFNPWTQGEKFDKNAEYIKKWLPEFKNIPSKDIHKWEKIYSKYNIKYPKPIINYKESRHKTIKTYKQALER
jgi:deoxyribodipyrimidine photo-lyase